MSFMQRNRRACSTLRLMGQGQQRCFDPDFRHRGFARWTSTQIEVPVFTTKANTILEHSFRRRARRAALRIDQEQVGYHDP
jgi:hypothetical protein